MIRTRGQVPDLTRELWATRTVPDRRTVRGGGSEGAKEEEGGERYGEEEGAVEGDGERRGRGGGGEEARKGGET